MNDVNFDPINAFLESQSKIGFYKLKYSPGTKGSCVFVPGDVPASEDRKPTCKTKGVYSIFSKDECLYVGQGVVWDRVRKFYRVAWCELNGQWIREDTRHPAGKKFASLAGGLVDLDHLLVTYYPVSEKLPRLAVEAAWIDHLRPQLNVETMGELND